MNTEKSQKVQGYFYEQICKAKKEDFDNSNSNNNNGGSSNNGGSNTNNGGSSNNNGGNTDNGGSSNNNGGNSNNNGGNSNNNGGNSNNNGGNSNNNGGNTGKTGGFTVDDTVAPKVVSASEGGDDNLTVILGSALGAVAVLAVGVAVAYYTIKKRKESGDDVDTTPKKKSERFSSIKNLFNNLSKPAD